MKQKLYRLKHDLRRYGSLPSKEETERQLDANIQLKRTELEELSKLHAKEYLISIDEYEPKYSFVNSKDYLQRIQQNKLKQKQMRDQKQAFICDAQWTIENDKRKGNKMIKEHLEIIKIAFENECKYAIKEVKYNNVDSINKKISNTFDKINKHSQTIHFRISEEYLKLKREELYLKYECEEKLQEEKEIEKERSKELKKQKKDREDIEKARLEEEEAEEREKQYQEELKKVHLEKEKAVGLAREEYDRKIKDLEQQLDQANLDKEKARSRSQRLKSGYIYIISNIGSLGRGIYRIFMTQNSTPDAFVRSMKPYVPFPFDIHFKIFSEEASETIQYLHDKFNDRRVNIVNERRDFFKVELSEIEQVIQEIETETGALTILLSEKAPQAYEYRKTQAAERKQSGDTTINKTA
ncbi:MAG: DUF4041 domain-containing protein [Microcoleaceae cyanobacterium]